MFRLLLMESENPGVLAEGYFVVSLTVLVYCR